MPQQEPTPSVASGARGAQLHVALTSFFALFATVGLGYYGLSFFYDFMVRDYGWTRGQVTSGNAVGKLLVGPVFGFVAGWVIDRFGPRRLMLAGLALGGVALAGLGTVSTLPFFYLFFVCNALSYVCGGPLPNQVLLSRWFDRARGKAMGFAYLGIGIGGAIAPRLAHALTETIGWNQALRALGVLFVLLALPLAFFVRDSPEKWRGGPREEPAPVGPLLRKPAFYLLAIGSMCSIGAVGGTMLNLKLFLALDRMLPQAEVARVLSLVLTFSIVGRLLMGWCADRFAKKRVMIFIYLLVTAGLPILLDVHLGLAARPVCRRVRDRPGRRLHDHSADGGRAVRGARARPGDGPDPDGGRRGRGRGAVDRCPDSGPERELRGRFRRPHRARRAGRGRGLASAVEGCRAIGSPRRRVIRSGVPPRGPARRRRAASRPAPSRRARRHPLPRGRRSGSPAARGCESCRGASGAAERRRGSRLAR